MGVYKFYKCPSCGSSIESFIPEYAKGIGEPFIVCSKCHTNVVLKEIYNEWELLTPSQKIGMRLRAVYTALMLGGFGGFILVAILLNIFPDYLPKDDAGLLEVAIISSIIGVIIVFLTKNNGLNKDIEKSKKRMTDPLYVKKLKELGLTNADIDKKYL